MDTVDRKMLDSGKMELKEHEMKDDVTRKWILIEKVILSISIVFLVLLASIIIETILPFRGEELTVVVAPIVEELLKALAILIMILLVNKWSPPSSSLENSALFWGLVIGLAFGTIETAFWPGTIALKVARIPTIFMHSVAGGLSGLAIDLMFKRGRLLVAPLIGGILFHSMYNLISDNHPSFGLVPMLIFLILVILMLRHSI